MIKSYWWNDLKWNTNLNRCHWLHRWLLRNLPLYLLFYRWNGIQIYCWLKIVIWYNRLNERPWLHHVHIHWHHMESYHWHSWNFMKKKTKKRWNLKKSYQKTYFNNYLVSNFYSMQKLSHKNNNENVFL